MFSGKSSESITPLKNLKYGGMSSGQLSVMKTFLTYSFNLFSLAGSYRSNGFVLGIKFNTVYSI